MLIWQTSEPPRVIHASEHCLVLDNTRHAFDLPFSMMQSCRSFEEASLIEGGTMLACFGNRYPLCILWSAIY